VPGDLVLLSEEIMLTARSAVVSSRASLRRGALVAGLVTALVLGLAACGSTSGAGTHPSSSEPVYEVTTAQVGNLGTILVDGSGYTLYLWEPDHQSGRSTCYGPCAVEWSPLTLPSGVKAPIAGSGITASKLSTTRRTDGTTQVTYNGWPLYTWWHDSTPGQATGQGLDNVGGLWYVLDPAGNAIT
jgi:predicted lipoprotein with Yx(FWY)xxD motif